MLFAIDIVSDNRRQGLCLGRESSLSSVPDPTINL